MQNGWHLISNQHVCSIECVHANIEALLNMRSTLISVALVNKMYFVYIPEIDYGPRRIQLQSPSCKQRRIVTAQIEYAVSEPRFFMAFLRHTFVDSWINQCISHNNSIRHVMSNENEYIGHAMDLRMRFNPHFKPLTQFFIIWACILLSNLLDSLMHIIDRHRTVAEKYVIIMNSAIELLLQNPIHCIRYATSIVSAFLWSPSPSDSGWGSHQCLFDMILFCLLVRTTFTWISHVSIES